jgi:hypothetical protein
MFNVSGAVFYPRKDAFEILRDRFSQLFGEAEQRTINASGVTVKVLTFTGDRALILARPLASEAMLVDVVLPTRPSLEDILGIGEALRTASSRASILLSQINRLEAP